MRSVIAVKKPGLVFPKAWADKFAEEYPDILGVASPAGDAVFNHVFDPASEKIDLAATIMEVQEDCKDQYVAFWGLQVGESDLDVDCFQPFNVITEEDGTNDKALLSVMLEGVTNEKSLLSIMLEGSFDKYATNKEKPLATPEYNFVDQYLYEKITNLYQQVGGDMKKLLQLMNDPKVRAELQPHFGARGSMIIIPSEGEIATLSNNKEHQAFTAGFTTRALNYKEEVPQEEPKTEVKSMSWKDRKAKAAGTVAPVTLPANPPPTSVPQVPVETPKADPRVSIVEKNEAGVLWVYPPMDKDFRSNATAVKRWWNTNSSINRPKEHAQMLDGFPASALKKDSPLRAHLLESNSAFRDAMEKAEKDRAARVASSATDNQPTHLLLVPGEEKKKTIEAAKVAAKQTVAQIAEAAKNIPKYSEQIAVPLGTILQWPIEFLSRRTGREKDSLINELRMELIQAKPSLLTDTAKPAEPPQEKPQEIETVNEPVKEEEPKKQLSWQEKKALRAAKAA